MIHVGNYVVQKQEKKITVSENEEEKTATGTNFDML